MRNKFNNLLINYRVKRNDNNDSFVLLLHGWGGSLDSFKGLENFLLDNGYSTINVDFPGFGASELPRQDFTLNDYVEIIKELLNKEKIDKVSIVSHSFGGRVAILLASTTEYVDNLILVDSAGLKPRFNLLKYIKIKIFKLKKFLNKKLNFKFNLDKYGSQDYRAMPNDLKCVFNRIINEDLTKKLQNINCRTLIVWGEKDKSTPLYMAKKLNKKIKNSQLVIYKNSGHFSYIENHNDFCDKVNKFLKVKENE